MTSPDKAAVLIVEDDRTIASLLAENLSRWGYEAAIVEDFTDVMGAFDRVRPDLVLLDISLPHVSGYTWCAEIRRQSSVPILFLSSRSENMDIVMAMHMGGDDYITKPFSMEVLLAKLGALMRRAYQYDPGQRPLSAMGLALDAAGGVAEYAGKRAELTRNEARLLRVLLENKNATVSRDRLMRALWDDAQFVDENTLSVGVARLRRKLAEMGMPRDFIRTRKGEGYIIREG